MVAAQKRSAGRALRTPLLKDRFSHNSYLEQAIRSSSIKFKESKYRFINMWRHNSLISNGFMRSVSSGLHPNLVTWSMLCRSYRTLTLQINPDAKQYIPIKGTETGFALQTQQTHSRSCGVTHASYCAVFETLRLFWKDRRSKFHYFTIRHWDLLVAHCYAKS
jgi:hypothetical protein